MWKAIFSGVAAAALAVPAAAGVVVTVEAPGVANTTQSLAQVGVETFDSYAPGTYASLSSNFGGTSSYSGTYAGPQIHVADSWGGDGNSQYVVALGQGQQYTLTLNKSADYFGFWLSALSSGNHLAFYNGSSLVASYDYTSLGAIINAAAGDYMGSPFTGQGQNELYAFLNFNFDNGDRYDSIVFSNSGTDGFESDNHTVGNTVPEPATWALLITGFGLVGLAARRRRTVARATA